LDGSDQDVGSSADVQLEALVCLLTEALQADAAIAGGSLAADRPRSPAETRPSMPSGTC